jgi:hypothetical protein
MRKGAIDAGDRSLDSLFDPIDIDHEIGMAVRQAPANISVGAQTFAENIADIDITNMRQSS